jgi:hypothetical protein
MNNLFFSLFIGVSLFTNPLFALEQRVTWPKIKTYKYYFSKKEHFSVSFADYPVGEEQFFELHSAQASALPQEIISVQRSLKISGNNHSDDLFMYAYKKLNHLKPNTRYQVSFSLEFASNANKESIGAGGGPGTSVYMKIGVAPQKPVRYVDSGHYYRMSLDKGNQANDGKDMILIGDVGVDNQDSLYRLKTLPYQPTEEMLEKINNYQFTSTKNGEGWLVFGTDSGYESTTSLFYTNVVVTFKEMD